MWLRKLVNTSLEFHLDMHFQTVQDQCRSSIWRHAGKDELIFEGAILSSRSIIILFYWVLLTELCWLRNVRFEVQTHLTRIGLAGTLNGYCVHYVKLWVRLWTNSYASIDQYANKPAIVSFNSFFHKWQNSGELKSPVIAGWTALHSTREISALCSHDGRHFTNII